MLSQKAQDTLTEFAAVKNADVQLQTTLGNRKGQIAANIIGAFAESQNSAFGWQVRAFGAENDTKGANAGIFFRRVDGESLYGINSFVDYEKGKYGDFLRYGIGGELQNRYVAFAANLYLPITDDKHTGSTVAFSQEGYDANLRINIPQLDFLKVRADYYHYSGEYGVENDKGLRYGLELQPISNLRIGAFYDDGGEKFGGDIAYVYNISPPQKRESTGFAPDLFSPIVREYSQRIITATTGPQIQILRTPDMITFMTATILAITTTTTMTTPHLVEVMTVAGNSRAASVQVTTSFDTGPNYEEVTTAFRFLVTLPPLPVTPPIVVRVRRNLHQEVVNSGISNRSVAFIVADNLGGIPGDLVEFENSVLNYDLTVVIGSEQFVAALMTTTMTTDGMTTETPTIIMARTITTAITAFLTTTMTIGAANIDSHFPPSFPPSSFPPFPQVPKLALAAIPRPQLSFPRRRESTLLPFCYLRVAQTAIYRRKWQTTAAALPPVIMGGKAALHTAAFSRIATQCGLRYAQMAKMRR